MTAPPRSQRRWLRILMLLVIFLSGGVVGVVGGGFWMRDQMAFLIRNPQQIPDQILPKIRSELSLADDQILLVEDILRRHYATMESVRAEIYPKQLDAFKTMDAEVSRILNPDQRHKWSSILVGAEQRYLPVRPVGPPTGEKVFNRFDANKDGVLTQDEVPPGAWNRLQPGDKDGDGKITLREYQDSLPK